MADAADARVHAEAGAQADARADVEMGPERARRLRERAEPLLAVASAAAPRRVEPWRDRARNLARLGRLDAALAVLADGTTKADDPAPLQWLRIGLVRQSGRLDAAQALMQAYLREHPDDPDMLHDLAVLQGQRGRWPAAAATARRLREMVPGDARGWLDLAVAQSRLGRRAEAIATLEAGLAAVDDEAGRTLLRVNLARLRDDGS
jgi:tetratricopeptide (TPR) repeat protein